jgi:ferredoxin
MQLTQVYYFSGTGNSYKVAKDLSAKLQCDLIPIKDFDSLSSIRIDAGKIGFVFPAYFMRIPRIVKRFLNKVESLENRYIFSVITVAGISEIINKKNGILSAGFVIRMPPSYIDVSNPLSQNFQNAILSKSSGKIDTISTYIIKSKVGKIESFNPLLTLLFKGLIEKRFSRGLFEPTDDKHFWADENCSKCNLCIRICPVNNISWNENKLVWNGKCEKCLACINWCPQKAIQYREVTKKRERYHHPDVNAQEMIADYKRKSTGQN